MRRLIREISVIPGVCGLCIFDKNAGALCSEFSADLPVDLPESVGIHFVRLIQMGTMNKLDIKSAHFRFDRYTVVGLPLDTGAIMLAICESDANCSLVATTAAMLAEDMRDELIDPLSDSQKQQNAAPADEQRVPVENKKVLASLKPQLDEIEFALAAAIGPIAGMVMTDYLGKWFENGPVEASRLGELVSMLIEEIGDGNLAKEFKAKLKHLQ